MNHKSPVHARWAVATLFFLHGCILGAWVPHIPLAKERLAVGPGVFGLALLAIAGGAVCAMPLAGALINRLGSARLCGVSGAMLCVLLLGPVMSGSLSGLMLTGFAFGAAIGSMDVAMNAHGIAVEKTLRLPTMSLFHGGWSVGGLVGTFVGAGLLKLLGPLPQALIASLLCLAMLLAAIRFLLPGSVDKGLSGSHFAWPSGATIGLGLLCFLALMIEGSILDWGAIVMRERFLLDASVAALAFGCYQGGMAVARLSGDRLRMKFGAVRMVTVSAVMTAAGTATALAVSSPGLSIAAFIFAGLGIGNVAPVLFAGGGRLEPDAPGRGIAAVTTLGYAGFLAGPPLIGFAAELVTLPWALGLTVLAALIIALCARMVDAADTF